MARPIRETPLLFGGDAHRFFERMKNPPTETPRAARSLAQGLLQRLGRHEKGRGEKEMGNLAFKYC